MTTFIIVQTIHCRTFWRSLPLRFPFTIVEAGFAVHNPAQLREYIAKATLMARVSGGLNWTRQAHRHRIMSTKGNSEGLESRISRGL